MGGGGAQQNISRVSSVFLVRVYRVCFFYESSILSKNFRSLLIRKLIFGQNFISEIVFLHVVTYIRVPPFFPVRLFVSAVRLVPLEPNRARKCRPGKDSADSSSDFRLERTEMKMITFRYSRKLANLGKFKGFSFPLAAKFPSSEIFFRIFDHFCELLSSRVRLLNEGKFRAGSDIFQTSRVGPDPERLGDRVSFVRAPFILLRNLWRVCI